MMYNASFFKLISVKNYIIIVNATDNLQKTTISWWYATGIYRMIASRGERMKFCDKLQKIRKENNITQEQLADKLDVSRQAVSKWESGLAYPDTEKLIQISKIFKVSLDDLINDNKDTSKTKNNQKFNFIETFNLIFEEIRKVFAMFFSMKFMEKIKFLLEMALVVLAIFLTASLINEVILSIIRRIFAFLPYQAYNVIDYLVYTILYVGWIILGVMFFIKVLKVRYLDYYVIIEDDTVNKQVVEEPIKELKDNKDIKVVIRDPEHSSFSFFKKVWNLFTVLLRIFCVFLAIPIVFGFILFLGLFVISLSYIVSGLFFNGISIALFGMLLFIFLLLEFIYNVIFNLKNNYKKYFIIFIASISLIGIGGGLSFISFSSFTPYSVEELSVNKDTIELDMRDNLLFYAVNNISDDKIIIDNNLDNIKVDLITYGKSKANFYTFDTYNYNYDDDSSYLVADIYVNYDELAIYKSIIDDFKKKKINTKYLIDGYHRWYDIDKIYISSDNLTKIKENIKKNQ